MKAILEIDAAWTANNPSGVALVRGKGKKWQCLAVAPSYESFVALADDGQVNWQKKEFKGSHPDVSRLLVAAEKLAGKPVDLVAIDMPVSRKKITSRREADDQISREFGDRNCGAHSPSPARPGTLGEDLTRAFKSSGFNLVTDIIEKPSEAGKVLIEVYPHPALLSLLQADQRVQYKVSKSLSYWQEASVPKRINNLLEIYQAILEKLSERFSGLGELIRFDREITCLAHLKKYEDALDALICAWVGVEFLGGRVIPLGDDTAAIWCPADVVSENRGGSLPRK